MRQTTQITIEHIVVASDRSYEQVIEALKAQPGLRADWENIARALITPNASWEQAVQIGDPHNHLLFSSLYYFF